MIRDLSAIPRRTTSPPVVVYTHLLLNGALQSLADALLQPAVLLAAVVWMLGGSTTDVAMLAVAASLPWALSAVIMPVVLTMAESLSAVTVVSGIARAAAAALVAFIGWRVTAIGANTFVGLLVLAYLAYQVASAINAQAAHALVTGDRQPPMSRRGLTDRRLGGALAAGLAALVAWRVFAAEDISLPRAAGWILMLAGLAVVAATWFQLTLPGLPRLQRSLPAPFVEGTFVSTLRSIPMRRFLTFRFLLGVSTLADPFIIVYALSEMRLDMRYLGGSVLAYALALIVGEIAWSALMGAKHARRPLQVAALLRLAALPLALVLPGIAASTAYQERFDSLAAVSWAFVAVFALLGLSRSAHDQAEQHYLADITTDPPHQRAAIMITNVLLVLTGVAALVGAALVNRYSLATALVVAATAAFLALLASGFLIEGNPRVLYRSALRPRRLRRRSRLRRAPGPRRR